VVQGEDRRGRREEEEDLRLEEIRGILRKVKDGKALGMDGVPGEAWKYGGEEMEEWVWKVCNKIWKGEGWPEEWKEGVLIPIVKKGQGMIVEEYRGVTVMPALYKICASALAERRGGREGVITTESNRIQERDGDNRQYFHTKLFD